MPYYNRDPKRDHNFDNHPFIVLVLQGTRGSWYMTSQECFSLLVLGLGLKPLGLQLDFRIQGKH